MNLLNKYKGVVFLLICIVYSSCKLPAIVQSIDAKPIPVTYTGNTDTTNSADLKWKEFFSDNNLSALIDTALKNNLDVLMTWQDIQLAQNDVLFRKSFLLPSVSGAVGMGVEKVGHYTSQGAGDASADITPGKRVPDVLRDYFVGFRTSWEADVWGKFHNAKKAAFARYLSSVEGKNFVLTNLVSEIANSYYELLALDTQLDIIRETIQLQQNALEIVKVMKQASVVTELAVKQFEAQVYNSQSLEYDILQQITENENKINFLAGRYPQPVMRNKSTFLEKLPIQLNTGIPSQLLKNRTDIKQAELELFATKCDVKVAQAEFYPSLGITGLLGFQAFKQSYLFTTPESLAFSLLGDLTAPLINRNAIKAEFSKAKTYQLQAMYNYQKAILNGYVEVSNEMSNIKNLQQLYALKSKEVETRSASIDISNELFKSAKANYLEVLMAQKEALASKLELVDVKKRQFNSMTNMYKSLGGGWN